MSKYCETYGTYCVCPSCEGVACGYSEKTRNEAQITRGVSLGVDGAVQDAPEYSCARSVSLEVLLPSDQREREVAITRRMIWGVAAGTAVLAMAGYINYILILGHSTAIPVEAKPLVLKPEEAPKLEAVVVKAALPDPLPPVLVSDPDWFPELPLAAPAAPPAPSPADEHRVAGNSLAMKQRFDEARVLYEKAIEVDPNYFQGYNNLANTYSDTGDQRQAQELYEQGLKISPDSPTLHFNLANSLFRQQQFGEAVRPLRRVVQENPNDIDAHLLLGICFFRLEQWEQSAIHFDSMLKIDRHHPEATFNLSLALDRMGHRDIARIYHRVALNMKPELAQAAGVRQTSLRR